MSNYGVGGEDMDDQQIPIELFNDFVVRCMVILGGFLVISLIVWYFTRSRYFNLFERGLSMLKAVGYAGLACGAYFLTYSDGRIISAWPQSLSLAQCFIILLGIFESISNFVAVFKIQDNDDKRDILSDVEW